MKIIFLDIDGVLNSATYMDEVAHARPVGQYMSPLDHDLSLIDPVAVARLERIIASALDVKIVISSTWRLLHPLDEIRGFLKARGGDQASKVIIDRTPGSSSGRRGPEINNWLELHSGPEDKFVILDDDADMMEWQLPFFVQTDFLTGLTDKHVEQAIRILTV
jgi:hypothetical protein